MREELIEAMARAAFERRHKGAKNCYAWDDFWEENEYQRVHYMNEAEAAKQAHDAALKAQGFVVVPGWRPIETAPRDGTHFIAAWQCKVSGQLCVSGDVYNLYGNWISVAEGMIYPTHWMPLPASPLAGGE
jgi:hypothetical protein